MKKMIAIFSLLCLITTISLAQRKNLQLSFNLNPIDSYVAGEFNLSNNSTLYTAIGFGYGSINSIYLNNYYDKSRHHTRNSDVAIPQIFFAPYINIQYRNYYLNDKDIKKGKYTGNNSGMYAGARFKTYTSPAIPTNDVRSIKQNYMLGLMIGSQRAFGAKRRFLFNINSGISTHANYNLTFFVFKPMLHSSIGYVIK